MGRQALTSKESELARSNTISPGNPQGTPNIPRYSTSGFQKAAQQTPVLGLGPDSLERLPLKISQTYPK